MNELRKRLCNCIDGYWMSHLRSNGRIRAWRLRELMVTILWPSTCPAEEREPLSFDYVWKVVCLIAFGHLRLTTGLWALKNRPAAVCGNGGSFAVAKWLREDCP
jgi:hypothetical protein